LAAALAAPETREETMSLELISDEFESGGAVPAAYTCSGRDVSPPLRWRGVPDNAETLALIVDDPDAASGIWAHWVIYNIPANLDHLPAAVPRQGQLASGARQGRNDFGQVGYSGPCPPPGPAHRYFFRLYAVDRQLEIRPGASRAQLLDALQDHILDQTEFMAHFGRTR
jgi:Raf kinase inhibitor-like YbhB/YbcL family protein